MTSVARPWLPPRWLRGLALGIGLAACASPVGAPVEACPDGWAPELEGPPVGFSLEPRLVEIECWRLAGDRLLEVGVPMPAGPDCFVIDRVEQLEGSEAVSVAVFIGRRAGPVAGACPPEQQTWSVEVQLREPLGERQVLDGARRTDGAGYIRIYDPTTCTMPA